jgi:hypothetical protein
MRSDPRAGDSVSRPGSSKPDPPPLRPRPVRFMPRTVPPEPLLYLHFEGVMYSPQPSWGFGAFIDAKTLRAERSAACLREGDVP